MTDELCRLSALDVVQLLAQKEVSPLDLVEASIERIESVDPSLNAMPTHCFDRAREHARRIMRGKPPALPYWLGGVPIAVKDLTPVAGVRTTWGSPIYRDHVPQASDLMIDRLEANGAIVMGKSNTPEFGAGASTFNEVFGKTRNPWNTAKSVAGSSGGSAAALASGQVWLATGSDMGGSLRLPASFNAVLGLRPTPGVVARGPDDHPFDTLSVDGPMARRAADLALMLDAMSGAHPRDPLASHPPPRGYLEATRHPFQAARLGWSADLGVTVVDEEVRRICQQAAETLASACGAELVPAHPDLSAARDTFQVLRAASYAGNHRDHLRDHRDQLKPEVIWNIEQGLRLTVADVAAAETARGRMIQSAAGFFETFDLLLCPTAIVPPFDVDVRYVERVGDHEFDNYVDWMMSTYAITLLGCASMSVPAGFTRHGLPVGLQLVAPPRCEHRILAAALTLERASDIASLLPVDPAE